KVIYNMLLMMFLSVIAYIIYSLIFDNPVGDPLLYFVTVLLGAMSFATVFTMVSGISSKTGSNSTLMAILSFPVIIPLLIVLIRLADNALKGLERSVSYKGIPVLLAINLIPVTLSLCLFPSLWRDEKGIFFRNNGSKVLAAIMVCGFVVAGFMGPVPEVFLLHETIRNVYFHVPMWFTMLTLYTVSVVYSIKYLSSGKMEHDMMAVEAVNTGIVFCFCGLLTGMQWANITWGAPWPNDPQLNGSAIATLMYLAYLVLRNAMDEEQKRGKISAVYNIFSFPIMVVLLYILPKMTDSLH